MKKKKNVITVMQKYCAIYIVFVYHGSICCIAFNYT